MDNNRFNVAEFSALIGCSKKTVYTLINREELKTVNEVSKGRKIQLIIADENKIKELQEIYGKIQENESICKENVIQEDVIEGKIIKNSDITEIFEKVFELQNTFNEQLKTYTDELITFKSQVPLLEDRNGLYLQQIKDIEEQKKVIEAQKERYVKTIIGLSITFFVIILVLSIFLSRAYY